MKIDLKRRIKDIINNIGYVYKEDEHYGPAEKKRVEIMIPISEIWRWIKKKAFKNKTGD